MPPGNLQAGHLSMVPWTRRPFARCSWVPKLSICWSSPVAVGKNSCATFQHMCIRRFLGHSVSKCAVLRVLCVFHSSMLCNLISATPSGGFDGEVCRPALVNMCAARSFCMDTDFGFVMSCEVWDVLNTVGRKVSHRILERDRPWCGELGHILRLTHDP